MDHEATCGGCGVDGLVEAAKVDAAPGEVVDGGHEMRQGASEAVEAPYDEGVALIELGQGLISTAHMRPGFSSGVLVALSALRMAGALADLYRQEGQTRTTQHLLRRLVARHQPHSSRGVARRVSGTIAA